ncbi:hypothetical protein MMEU_3584 [Mycobacterium marinum str. Europe]|nr:hypothetical protein MMEU_3584 [Mycobacterium marinum str. Europe]
MIKDISEQRHRSTILWRPMPPTLRRRGRLSHATGAYIADATGFT